MNHEEPIIKNKEWIGRIPSDWDFVKIKEHFVERNTKVDDISFPPLSVSMGGVVDQMENVSKSDNSENRKLVKMNDFVINSRSDRKGSSGISPRDGSVSVINIVLKPKNINPKYSEYLFKSYYFKEEFFRNGKGIHFDLWSTRYELMKQIFIPYPKIEEQNEIVEYLDNKTHQIEKLTKKIEQKIELLKEQRTSLINEVATKGLNPNVEMKNSYIEFIGEIPSHWEKSKLKYKGDFFSGYSFDSNEFISEGEIRVLKISNIQNDGISWSDLHYLPESFYHTHQNFIVNKGDLVFSLTRPIISTGIKVCFFNENYKTLLNQRNSVFRPDESSVIKRFLFYLVRTFSFVQEFKQQLKETNQPNISTEQISNILMFFPPINEQQKIVEYLDEQTQKIDKTISTEEKRIKLLKEYKQSLISEVVTGKRRVV
jgi:type I restriction enzyme, S subunit